MRSRTIVLRAGFALSALLLVYVASPAEENAPPTRPPARVYTNADLDRVHAFSAETGVRSVPAVSVEGRRAPSRTEDDRPRSRGESYWRAEARRVRERVAALAVQADELRARLAAEEEERQHFSRTNAGRSSRSRASLGGGADPVATARLAAIALRMRSLEDDLAERARRDGALPGWLR